MATKLDVVQAALRRLGVIAADESATAEQLQIGGEALVAIEASLGFRAPFSVEDVPATSFLPLAELLAADLAAVYMVAPPASRARAWHRFMATIRSDDRETAYEDPAFF